MTRLRLDFELTIIDRYCDNGHDILTSLVRYEGLLPSSQPSTCLGLLIERECLFPERFSGNVLALSTTVGH
jgi:hypothetical protein